jgi:hypothetical protein
MATGHPAIRIGHAEVQVGPFDAQLPARLRISVSPKSVEAPSRPANRNRTGA